MLSGVALPYSTCGTNEKGASVGAMCCWLVVLQDGMVREDIRNHLAMPWLDVSFRVSGHFQNHPEPLRTFPQIAHQCVLYMAGKLT